MRILELFGRSCMLILECVSECKFPRQIQLSVNTEIHAFSDASMRAYGAVLFAVTNDRG